MAERPGARRVPKTRRRGPLAKSPSDAANKQTLTPDDTPDLGPVQRARVDLNPTAARAARSAGASLADDAAGQWWRDCADAAITAMAARRSPTTGLPIPFTIDDLLEVTGLPQPRSPRAIGARFLAAARGGVITPVAYATSRRAVNRCAPVRVWVGGAR